MDRFSLHKVSTPSLWPTGHINKPHYKEECGGLLPTSGIPLFLTRHTVGITHGTLVLVGSATRMTVEVLTTAMINQ